MDFSGYQPQSAALEPLSRVDFVAVVGPTAVGKSTLMKAVFLQHPDLRMILTQTSRTPRPGEIDGLDINFRSRDRMLARIDRHEFVQVAPSLLGDIYATGPEDYPEDGVGMMAVLASALDAFRTLPFRSFRVAFIVPPSWEQWQVRIRVHGFEPHRLAKRLQEAKESFSFALDSREAVLIINDDLARAATDLAAVASGETPGLRLQADQARAKEIIRGMLPKLK